MCLLSAKKLATLPWVWSFLSKKTTTSEEINFESLVTIEHGFRQGQGYGGTCKEHPFRAWFPARRVSGVAGSRRDVVPPARLSVPVRLR